jgi:TM2 domain-containing membrane protein YozV
MQKRNNILTYILALIPGLGYMYLGLIVKGVETLAIYLMIDPVFGVVGLDWLAKLVKIPIWFYVFFDTINTSKRMDNGEVIRDEDFILKRFNNKDFSGGEGFTNSETLRKNGLIAIGWLLVVLGVLALGNRLLITFGLANIIRHYTTIYFVPVIFILIGLYLLFRNRK